ncbi:MAG: hypothetical protein RLZ12_467, partial [Bacillota bacterium]
FIIFGGKEIVRNILASAGVIGLVLGVGAQNVLKDLWTGFFLIGERQLEVGDFVLINQQIKGTVEEVGLRVTKIKDFEQRVHYIPNSTIKHVTNYSRGNIGVFVSIILPFETNVEKVLDFLEEGMKNIAVKYSAKIIDKPQVLGLTDITPFGVKLTVLINTKPEAYFYLACEVRKEVLSVLQQKKITFCYVCNNSKSNKDCPEI